MRGGGCGASVMKVADGTTAQAHGSAEHESLSSSSSSAAPPPPPGIQQDSLVVYEGIEYTIQYITSKGMLDLRSTSTGDVEYGVPKDRVQAVHADAAASTAKATGSEPGPTSGNGNGSARARALEEPMQMQPALELLGEPLSAPGGSGARVHRCRLDGLREDLAVKLLPRSARSDQVAVLTAEIELCRSLSSASIVKFVHLATNHGIGGVGHCAIVMELLPVSLEGLITRRTAAAAAARLPSPRPFGAAALGSIARQMAAALVYLHEGAGGGLAVLHRDVKPGNIFFEAPALSVLQAELDESPASPAAATGSGEGAASDGAAASAATAAMIGACPYGRLRLGDFDVSVRAAEPLVEFTGTPSVSTPPEMWRHEPHHTAADIWALGCTLQWCLLLGDPFIEATMTELEERFTATPQPRMPIYEQQDGHGHGDASGAPAPAWAGELEPVAQLARQCCCAVPADRIAAAAILDQLDNVTA